MRFPFAECFTACLLLSPAWGLRAQTSAPNDPAPTAAMQTGIDKDVARHFGSAPSNPGPLAADLSANVDPVAIGRVVRKVADWELTQSQPYFDQIWTESVMYTGFMAASEATGDAEYRDAMRGMGEKFAWKERSEQPNADDLSIAQTYLELYQQDGKKHPEWIAPTKAEMAGLIDLQTLPKDNTKIPWWWCDALFMAPPVWGRMYAATGDRKDIEYIHTNWQRTYDLLWDKQEHLYARDATYIPKRGPNGKKIFWSRGEGWVMGGLARTIPYLPKGDPRRAFYEQNLREMAAAVAKLQDAKTGLWHASLLDPEDFPAPEVSGSALMVFGMMWGVNEGVLDGHTYVPVIARAWRGLLQHVYADGRLGDIQQTGAEPAYYLPGSSYTYGVGGFLLAGAELKRYAATHPITVMGATVTPRSSRTDLTEGR